MKLIGIIIMFFFFKVGYAETIWRGEDNKKLTVIYKVLHPLIVNIEEPEKLIINRSEENFTYSKKNERKAPILVTVKAPYNQESYDEILRKIYETVYFKLEDDGIFNLVHIDDNSMKISAEAYFIDDIYTLGRNKVKEYYKPFSSNTSGKEFITTTTIDVDFKNDPSRNKLGLYKGSLKLNVWFGGSIR